MLYLQITNNRDKNDMVSQMAHAKNLGDRVSTYILPWVGKVSHECVSLYITKICIFP